MEEEIVRDEDLYERITDTEEPVREEPRYVAVEEPLRVRERYYEHFSSASLLIDNIKDEQPAGYVGKDRNGYYLTYIPGHMPPAYRLIFASSKPLVHSYIKIIDYKKQPIEALKRRTRTGWVLYVYTWKYEDPPIHRPLMKRKEFEALLLEAVEPLEGINIYLDSIIYSIMGSPLIIADKQYYPGGIHLGLGGRYYSHVREVFRIIMSELPSSFKLRTVNWVLYDRARFNVFTSAVIEKNVLATGVERGVSEQRFLPPLDTLTLIEKAPKPDETQLMKYRYDVVDFILTYKLMKTYDVTKSIWKRARERAREVSERVRNAKKTSVVIVGKNKFLDYLTYIATPLGIVRLGEAIARYENASKIDLYHIDKASEHIEKIVLYYLEHFGRILPLLGIKDAKYTLLEILSGYPMSREELIHALGIEDTPQAIHFIDNLINKLVLTGEIYKDKKGRYHLASLII